MWSVMISKLYLQAREQAEAYTSLSLADDLHLLNSVL